MSRPLHQPDQNPLVLVVVLVAVGAVLFGIFRLADRTETSPTNAASTSSVAGDDLDAPRPATTPTEMELPSVKPGLTIQRKRTEGREPPPDPSGSTEPTGPTLAPASTGRSGTGITLGDLPALTLPVGPAAEGTVTTAVANLPRRRGTAGVRSSLGALARAQPDFVVLNEVGSQGLGTIEGAAPGYAAYRDPRRDTGRGGNQSMNNVIAWREDTWTLVDAGRVKLVENDVGFHRKRPFVWDRYATWAALQRPDGAIVSVVGTHMMTNPAKFPRQHGNPRTSRIQQYAYGMQVLRALVSRLERHGPVIVGGDMNSHPGQGNWSAVAQMRAAGYDYAKDRGVMYLFHDRAVRRLDSRQVRVASDHPALLTRLDLNGVSPTGG